MLSVCLISTVLSARIPVPATEGCICRMPAPAIRGYSRFQRRVYATYLRHGSRGGNASALNRGGARLARNQVPIQDLDYDVGSDHEVDLGANEQNGAVGLQGEVNADAAPPPAIVGQLDEPVGGAAHLEAAMPIRALDEEIRINEQPAHALLFFDDPLPESGFGDVAAAVKPANAPVETVQLASGSLAANAASSAPPPPALVLLPVAAPAAAIDDDFDFGPNFRLHDKLANQRTPSEKEVRIDCHCSD
jgi:hypothetical protein